VRGILFNCLANSFPEGLFSRQKAIYANLYSTVLEGPDESKSEISLPAVVKK
jgi:hypothetical protein